MHKHNTPENTLTINGFDLYYEMHGQGAPLLMLHGFTGSGVGLLAAFKELSKYYQLIIPDLRGHGRSTNPNNEFTFRQAAVDMIALLDHLNIDQCSAIGFSGGGCTLIHMAYQQPEIIESMAIISAAPYFPAHTRDIMRQFTIESHSPEEWEAMQRIHFHGDEQIHRIWQQANDMSNSTDDMNFTQEMLAKIKAKTLIVQGDHDPLYPIDITIELFKGIPNSHLWIIPNSGHVPINENNINQFNNYIKKFFNSSI